MSVKERLERYKEKYFVVGKEVLKTGEIPSIVVYGEILPEAWELATIATLEYGVQIPTEDDQEVDPESKDASVMIVVTDPLKEPRIHKHLPHGYEELYTYTKEIIEGVRDHWVREGGWSYSYHDRVGNWPGLGGWAKIDALVGLNLELPHIDQVEAMIKKLAVTPYTRRAQAITWVPHIDIEHHEPPCLQRIWCRLVKSEDDLYLFQMNTHWRSRDGFFAAFGNMYAFTEWQKEKAREISEISGRNVQAGRYLDISDSYHIPGKYKRKGDLDRFLTSIEERSFEERVIRSDNPQVQREFDRGRERLIKEVKPGAI